MLRPLFTRAALLCLVVLAACADPGIVGGGDGDLEGRTFLSQAVTGRTLVPDTEIRLTFNDGHLGATAGCNSLGAPYSLDGDTLVIDEGMSMTEIGCDPARHDQDTWLADFLTSKPTILLAGSELTLRDGTTAIELLDRELADPDRELVGTTWLVDSIITGEAVSSVPPEGHVTLEFPDDQSFLATARDCTSAAGPVQIGSDTLTFEDFGVDAIGCSSPWEETLQVLQQGRTTYDIEAGRLTIQAGENGISATAR